MNLISQIFLTLFIINTAAIGVFSILWKNDNINFSEFLLAGSFIYRDLPKYIKNDKIKPYQVLSYSAIILFMLFILSITLWNN